MIPAALPTPRIRTPVRRTCDNCGNRKCRRKWLAVCWMNCGRWIREVLPALPPERSK